MDFYTCKKKRKSQKPSNNLASYENIYMEKLEVGWVAKFILYRHKSTSLSVFKKCKINQTTTKINWEKN